MGQCASSESRRERRARQAHAADKPVEANTRGASKNTDVSTRAGEGSDAGAADSADEEMGGDITAPPAKDGDGVADVSRAAGVPGALDSADGSAAEAVRSFDDEVWWNVNNVCWNFFS
jgi:hypothetical protein